MREFREFCGDFEKKAADAELEKEALSPKLLRRAADVASDKALAASGAIVNKIKESGGRVSQNLLDFQKKQHGVFEKRFAQSDKFREGALKREKASPSKYPKPAPSKYPKPAQSAADKKIDRDFLREVAATERRMRGSKGLKPLLKTPKPKFSSEF